MNHHIHELFVSDYKLLQCFCANPDLSETRQISAILRRWLLDGGGFINIVNRGGPKLSFILAGNDVPGIFGMFDPVFQFIQLQPLDGLPTHPVNLSRFLSTPVLIYKNHNLTIKNLITIVANKWGGVHFDTGSKGSPEYDLKEIENDPFLNYVLNHRTNEQEVDQFLDAISMHANPNATIPRLLSQIAIVCLLTTEDIFFSLTEK